MSQNWEADKMLDVYIHDYLVKRNLHASAKAFQTEGKVSPDPVAIDAPGGFLYEWWSVFWDIFISRTNEKHSDVAASYIDTQIQKAREQQQQHHPQQQQQQQPHSQLQLQQIQLLQRHHAQQQQQRRDGGNILNSTSNGLVGNDSLLRQNTGTANAMATKIYEERLKLPHPRDAIDDSNIKRFGENSAQLLDTNQSPMLKPAPPNGQPQGQVLQSSSGNISTALHQVQVQDNKSGMNVVLNQRSTAADPALFGVSGAGLTKPNLLSSGINQGQNPLPTLKGYPLAGIEQLRPALLQQKPFLSSAQQFSQFQMLTPQQQQIVLQAQGQGNLASPGSILPELDGRRLQMMFSNQNPSANKDGQGGSVADVVQNAASPLSRNTGSEQDILLKLRMAQIQQHQQRQRQQQQQQQQPQQQPQQFSQAPPTQKSEVANPLQDKNGAALTVDSSLSNSFRGNDQVYSMMEPSPSTNSTGTGKDASKSQTAGRKRKQPGSSSGPAISSGTVNNTGPSASSAPSTPSTHTHGDVLSMASGKPLIMYGSDGTLASPSNQLVDMDRFGEDGSLDDNVESFLHDDSEPRDLSGRCMDDGKGFLLNEVCCLRAHTNKVVSCHFSSDGKLLASAGNDRKAVLWDMDTFQPKSVLDEHGHIITDVRFSCSSARLATSSFDRSVKVWDIENPTFTLRTFSGHSENVASVDFHPKNEDLLCSCDSNNDIRYWNVTQGKGIRMFKGGMKQVRFQSHTGRLLAAAAENIVSIFDAETDNCLHSLKGHIKPVHSLCWDPSGDYLASVSEDSARVWSLRAAKNSDAIHQLNCSGRTSQSCVFHPSYPGLLIIGGYQNLEVWDMAENKTMTIEAHKGIINSLAVSPGSGMIASASHDFCVKLWK
eukprot:TRINITY_DN1328_c0_g1_i2.p1 TRINITY_DN1328_c0_g1~~TRINITY_DN1328_c0_g1_i2.p1  ORF type:complete len:882 (+),score=232.53 TRINITY_DN1328_c0_g1_i2:548-3193(+)